MNYIINDKKEFVGISPIKMGNTVETEYLKPLDKGEKAIWNGTGFDYKFNNYITEPKIISNPSISSLLLSVISTTIRPVCGNETREHNGNISILIPCYKQSQWVKRAINSCLRQTQKPTEIIVLLMDEDSYKLEQELTEQGIVCYKEKQMNSSKARTYLAKKCKTDWFIFLDADDELRLNFIETLDKLDGAICFGSILNVENNKVTRMIEPAFETAIVNAIIQNSTCLMHKDFFSDIGQKEEFAAGGEDCDMILRALSSKRWKMSYTTKTHYIYHRNGASNILTKDMSSFNKSHENAILANKDFLITELTEIIHKNCTSNKALWLLKNYSEQNKRKFLNSITKIDLSLFENKLKRYFYEIVIKSKYKETKHIYDRNKYISPSGEYINDTSLMGRSFDVVFFNCNNIENLVEFFTETKNMLIHEDVYNKMKSLNLTPVDEVLWLLENYCCFEINCDKTVSELKDTTEEVESIISQCNLTEEIKKHYSDYIDAKYESFFISLPLPKVKATFKLHQGCNKRCHYCFQETYTNKLTDEEMYENFDKLLTLCEERYNGNIFPHIMGGEPTLWSDWLQNKIINRLKNYREVLLFTNGTNKDCPLFKAPNFMIETHITDWIGTKVNDYKMQKNEFITIVVPPNEIKHIKDFVSITDDTKNMDTYAFITPSVCNNPNNKYFSTLEEINKINDALKDTEYVNKSIVNYLRKIKEDGLEKTREQCRQFREAYTFNCQEMTVELCINGCSSVPFDKFEFGMKPSKEDCKTCYNLCSYN